MHFKSNRNISHEYIKFVDWFGFLSCVIVAKRHDSRRLTRAAVESFVTLNAFDFFLFGLPKVQFAPAENHDLAVCMATTGKKGGFNNTHGNFG